jgi:hypothetical protein
MTIARGGEQPQRQGYRPGRETPDWLVKHGGNWSRLIHYVHDFSLCCTSALLRKCPVVVIWK